MDAPAPAPLATKTSRSVVSSVAFLGLGITPWIGGPLFLDLANLRAEHIKAFLVTMLALIILRVALSLIAKVSSRRLSRSASSYRATGAAFLVVAAAILGVLASEIMRHWFAAERLIIIPFYLHLGFLSFSWMPLKWRHTLFPFWLYLAAETSLAFLSFTCFTREANAAVALLAVTAAVPSVLHTLVVILTNAESAPSILEGAKRELTENKSRLGALALRCSQFLSPLLNKLRLSAVRFSQRDLVNVLLIAPPLLVGLGVHLTYLPRIYLLGYLALPFALTLGRKIRDQSIGIESLNSRIALTSAILPLILVTVKVL